MTAAAYSPPLPSAANGRAQPTRPVEHRARAATRSASACMIDWDAGVCLGSGAPPTDQRCAGLGAGVRNERRVPPDAGSGLPHSRPACQLPPMSRPGREGSDWHRSPSSRHHRGLRAAAGCPPTTCCCSTVARPPWSIRATSPHAEQTVCAGAQRARRASPRAAHQHPLALRPSAATPACAVHSAAASRCPRAWRARSRWDEALLRAVGAQAGERFRHDDTLAAGARFVAGELRWRAVAVPGHDMDALAYYNPERRILISGDALWRDGFGILFAEVMGNGDALGGRAAPGGDRPARGRCGDSPATVFFRRVRRCARARLRAHPRL